MAWHPVHRESGSTEAGDPQDDGGTGPAGGEPTRSDQSGRRGPQGGSSSITTRGCEVPNQRERGLPVLSEKVEVS